MTQATLRYFGALCAVGAVTIVIGVSLFLASYHADVMRVENVKEVTRRALMTVGLFETLPISADEAFLFTVVDTFHDLATSAHAIDLQSYTTDEESQVSVSSHYPEASATLVSPILNRSVHLTEHSRQMSHSCPGLVTNGGMGFACATAVCMLILLYGANAIATRSKPAGIIVCIIALLSPILFVSGTVIWSAEMQHTCTQHELLDTLCISVRHTNDLLLSVTDNTRSALPLGTLSTLIDNINTEGKLSPRWALFQRGQGGQITVLAGGRSEEAGGMTHGEKGFLSGTSEGCMIIEEEDMLAATIYNVPLGVGLLYSRKMSQSATDRTIAKPKAFVLGIVLMACVSFIAIICAPYSSLGVLTSDNGLAEKNFKVSSWWPSIRVANLVLVVLCVCVSTTAYLSLKNKKHEMVESGHEALENINFVLNDMKTVGLKQTNIAISLAAGTDWIPSSTDYSSFSSVSAAKVEEMSTFYDDTKTLRSRIEISQLKPLMDVSSVAWLSEGVASIVTKLIVDNSTKPIGDQLVSLTTRADYSLSSMAFYRNISQFPAINAVLNDIEVVAELLSEIDHDLVKSLVVTFRENVALLQLTLTDLQGQTATLRELRSSFLTPAAESVRVMEQEIISNVSGAAAQYQNGVNSAQYQSSLDLSEYILSSGADIATMAIVLLSMFCVFDVMYSSAIHGRRNMGMSFSEAVLAPALTCISVMTVCLVAVYIGRNETVIDMKLSTDAHDVLIQTRYPSVVALEAVIMSTHSLTQSLNALLAMQVEASVESTVDAVHAERLANRLLTIIPIPTQAIFPEFKAFIDSVTSWGGKVAKDTVAYSRTVESEDIIDVLRELSVKADYLSLMEQTEVLACLSVAQLNEYQRQVTFFFRDLASLSTGKVVPEGFISDHIALRRSALDALSVNCSTAVKGMVDQTIQNMEQQYYIASQILGTKILFDSSALATMTTLLSTSQTQVSTFLATLEGQVSLFSADHHLAVFWAPVLLLWTCTPMLFFLGTKCRRVHAKLL